jgi:hypothetical protein
MDHTIWLTGNHHPIPGMEHKIKKKTNPLLG